MPAGLDFGAIMMIGAAQDADLELLAETLPDYEIALLSRLNAEGDDGEDIGNFDKE